MAARAGRDPLANRDVTRSAERWNGATLRCALIREYLFISLFRACAESLASENASRLAAMERADRNINELLENLHGSFHRLRQSGIDEELFDVGRGLRSADGSGVTSSAEIGGRVVLLRRVRLFVVGLEWVAAEVVVEIAPDGVDVVGVVLRVVVLEDEAWSLDAVVVRLAGFDPARPGEVDLAEARFFDLRPVFLGEVEAMPAEIEVDELDEDGTLLRLHLALRESIGIRVIVAARDVDDFLGRFGEDHGLLLLVFVERFDELPPEILLRGEDAQAGARAGADFCRVRAEEGRRHRDHFLVEIGEVEREMVALHAPAPGGVRTGFAEDGEGVILRIAEGRAGLVLFELCQDFLHAHDGDGFFVAAAAQPACQQRLREEALWLRHFLHRQPFACARNEVPVLPFLVGKLKLRLGALLRA